MIEETTELLCELEPFKDSGFEEEEEEDLGPITIEDLKVLVKLGKGLLDAVEKVVDDAIAQNEAKRAKAAEKIQEKEAEAMSEN